MTAAPTLALMEETAQTLAQAFAAIVQLGLVVVLALNFFHGVTVTLVPMVGHVMRSWMGSNAPVHQNTQEPPVLFLQKVRAYLPMSTAITSRHIKSGSNTQPTRS